MNGKQDSPYQFHSSAKVRLREGEEALREMLDALLERFQCHAPLNLRIGQATSEMAVFPAGPNEYYAVVLLGPCETLETVDEAIVENAKRLVPEARKLGIK